MPPKRFATLAREYLESLYAEDPLLASNLGIAGHDDRLPDLRLEEIERRRQDRERWLSTMEELEPADIDDADRIDHAFVLANLRRRIAIDGWEAWRHQPSVYISPGLTGVYGLYLRRTRSAGELHRAAERRLRAIPWNLFDGKRNLDLARVAPAFVDRAIRQARAGARYVRDALPLEAEGEWRERLAVAGRAAADSLEDFAAHLEARRDDAKGDFAFGEERFTAVLRQGELLPYSALELSDLAEDVQAELDRDLRRRAMALSGTENWRGVVEQVRQRAPSTPDELTSQYASVTARARAFVVERGLATVPDGEACHVEPSPLFQRALYGGGYYGPPAFSSSRTGYLLVPYPPEGTPEAEVRSHLQGHSYANIPVFAVHESYPGHHLQRVLRAEHASAIRRSLTDSVFAEGWGLYAERLMREQGFFTDPREELMQVRGMFFRATRTVVDVGLHTRRLSIDDAVRYFVERARVTDVNARAEVGRTCSAPVYNSSYMIGQIEIVKLRERFFAKLGRSDGAALRAFHDRILAGGDRPLALAAKEVLA